MAFESQAPALGTAEKHRTEPIWPGANSAWQRYWPWAPLPLAGLYLILLLVNFQQIIAATYLNADAASAPMIGALAGHGNGAIVLGNMPWYSTLLFELGTRGLPLHRQLWELAPYAMALASIGLIAWSLERLSGRWAALLASAVLLCAGPQMLGLLFSLNDHSPTWFTLALLGAWTVALQIGTAPQSRRGLALLLALGISIALVAGVNAASDRLAVVGALVPLLLSGIFAWWRAPSARSRAGALAALATAALSAIVAVITTHLMHNHGVTYIGAITFGSTVQVQANLSLWWQSLAVLGNGNFFGSPIDFEGVLAAACAFVILAASAAALRTSWLELRLAPPADPRGHASNAGRFAYTAYWASAGLLLSVAYLLSSVPSDTFSSRYLVGVLYAALALTVLLAEHRPALRGAVVAGAFIYCLGGLVSMVNATATKNPSRYPDGRITGQVEKFASREGLKRGYAGYWDAAPISWASDLRLHVYPVFSCPAGLCQFYLHTIAGWYRPHPGERTFLLTDTTQPFLGSAPALLGPPSATHSIGQVTMYVYPYDIASRISPP